MSTVLIRDAKLSDAPRLLEIYSYYVKNTAITFEYNVPSLEEFRHRMKNITLRYPYIVLEADGKVMGYAYAGSFIGRAAYDWSCEMTVYLDRTAKKLGFGRKIYEAMEQRLKDMGILNLYACIGYIDKKDEYLNHNSADFHAHLGYKTVGTFKKCGSIVAAFVLFAPTTPKLTLYLSSFIASIFEELLLFANFILSFPFEVATPEKSLSSSAADETRVLSISSHFPFSSR